MLWDLMSQPLDSHLKPLWKVLAFPRGTFSLWPVRELHMWLHNKSSWPTVTWFALLALQQKCQELPEVDLAVHVARGTGPGTVVLAGNRLREEPHCWFRWGRDSAEGPVPVSIQKVFAGRWPPCFLPCEAMHREIPEASFSAWTEEKHFLPSPPTLTWPDLTRANGLEVGTHFFWTLACEPRWRDVAQEGELNTFTGRPKWAIRRWKAIKYGCWGKWKGEGWEEQRSLILC